MSTCIWCKSSTSNEPEEHILLEGLVGEQFFSSSENKERQIRLVLCNDEVCKTCNGRRLKPLDDYLLKQLGVFKVFLNPIGSKRGRPAKVEKPGLYAQRKADGPHIHVSGEKYKIPIQGGVIQPAGHHPEAVKLISFTKSGPMAEIKFTQTFRMNKRFCRALHKIALELLCFQEGPEIVLQPRFDAIRDYVLRGQGSRTILMGKELKTGEWEQAKATIHMCQFQSTRKEWLVEMQLGPLFYVDLSSNNDLLPQDKDELSRAGLICISDKGQINR